MKKIMRKLVAMTMVAVTICACFAGCKKKDKNKPIVLTVFSELANVSGEQMGWSAKILLEKFNVKLNIVPSEAGVYETLMEEGDLGDIVVWGGDGDNYQRAVKAGYLFDWNAENLLQKHGAYIYENMPHALEKNAQLTKKITEGASEAVYGFGHNVATSSESHEAFFYTWDIRWDLYSQLGYPEVKNLDDLVEVFKQMKEICPKDENGNDTYAVSLWKDWDGDMVMYVKALATAYFGYDEHGVGLYDPETGTFHDALEENGPYLECLKFFNKLYQNNLLDPNSRTQDYKPANEKVKVGGTFWSIFNYSGSHAYNTKEHLAENKMMLSLVPEEGSPIVYGMSVLGGNRIWSIGANTDYPELCMQIINWLTTPEGTMTYTYGPQGLCWDYDEAGYAHFTEFGKTAFFKRDTAMIGDYEGTGTFNDGCLQINNTTWSLNAVNPDSKVGETFNYEFWKSTQEDPTNDIEADWRKHFNVSSVQEYMENTDYTVAPSSTFAFDSKSDEFKLTWTSVTNAIVQYSWQAMYAETDAEFDSIVAEMKDKAEGYGYDQCVSWTAEQAQIKYQLEQALKK